MEVPEDSIPLSRITPPPPPALTTPPKPREEELVEYDPSSDTGDWLLDVVDEGASGSGGTRAIAPWAPDTLLLSIRVGGGGGGGLGVLV